MPGITHFTFQHCHVNLIVSVVGGPIEGQFATAKLINKNLLDIKQRIMDLGEEEGRRKKEEGRRKKEEARSKKEEGRRKEEGGIRA